MRRSAAPSNNRKQLHRPLLHRPLLQNAAPDAPAPTAAASSAACCTREPLQETQPLPRIPTVSKERPAAFKPPVRPSFGLGTQAARTPDHLPPKVTRYYTVLYTKDVHKKAKVWQDGVMTHTGKRLSLQDMEGKPITATNSKLDAATSEPMGSGAELTGSEYFSRYLVEIVNNIAALEVESGRIFLGGAALANGGSGAPSAPVVLPSTTGKFKSVRAAGPHKPAAKPPAPKSIHNPDAEGALVLARNPFAVVVDPVLCRFLRPHQREGVQFMYRCVMGGNNQLGTGCILADEVSRISSCAPR